MGGYRGDPGGVELVPTSPLEACVYARGQPSFVVQRRKLAGRLFLAKESFCAPLLELKKQMVEIQDVKLLDLSVKTFEPQQFVEYQSNRRQEAAKVGGDEQRKKL